MAHRYWEGAAIASRYAKYRPVAPDGLLNRMIGFLKEKCHGPLNLAYDVGCGSGQSTQLLAPHFSKVVGTDLSPAQVDAATKKNKNVNVTFKVSPAETIPEPDKSVQLISTSQAAHWFDLPKFYEEGRRVLSPGGIMCLIGYELPKFVWTKDPSKEGPLNEALMDWRFGRICANSQQGGLSWAVYIAQVQNSFLSGNDSIYVNELRGQWDDEARKIVDGRYAPYTIPYSDFMRDDTFCHDIETSVEDMVMLTTTWSGFTNFCQKNGEGEGLKLINKYRNRLMEILDEPTSPEETKFIKRTSFFLLMARNS